MTRFLRALHSIAPVRREEVVSVILLALNVAALLSCISVLMIVREPLILLDGGAELKAYASAGQIVVLFAVVPLFSALVSRTTRIQLLPITHFFFSSSLLSFYLLGRARYPLVFFFYLCFCIFTSLTSSTFCSFPFHLFYLSLV